MGHDEAVTILAANAACQLQNGCDACPLLPFLVDHGRQEGYCRENTSPEKVREAVIVIHQEATLKAVLDGTAKLQ